MPGMVAKTKKSCTLPVRAGAGDFMIPAYKWRAIHVNSTLQFPLYMAYSASPQNRIIAEYLVCVHKYFVLPCGRFHGLRLGSSMNSPQNFR